MLIMESSASHYSVCDRYATYFENIKGKPWSQTHAGARWEMSWEDELNIAPLVSGHLGRVGNEKPEDFCFDFWYMGYRMDPKATCSARPDVPNGLVLGRDKVRAGVIYLLGDYVGSFFPHRLQASKMTLPMRFRFRGWEIGDPSLFRNFDDVVPNCVVRDADKLRTREELDEYLRTGKLK